jgi:diacylglycerol kinase family enzyme
MHLLVGNPTAQSGRNAARIEVARGLMREAGIDHDFLPTEPGGRTVGAVASALGTGRYACVVAMGGDGTFAEVAKGLLASGTGVTMGMLPTGTANDQGRSFGLDAAEDALPRNVQVLADGLTAPLDAGRIQAFDELDLPRHQDWFFDSAGWGISARVLRLRNEDRALVSGVPLVRELYRDHAVYVGAVVRAFLASWVGETRFEAEVTTPSGTITYDGLTDLVVKNTRVYAGAWVFDDTASPEDGEMELVPIRGREEWVARAVVARQEVPLFETDLAEAGVALSPIVRAPWFDLRIHDRPMSDPVEAQLDGEMWPHAARYRVEVVRHAIRLVVPAT